MRTSIALAIVLLVGVWFSIYKTDEACTATGGTLVKGVVWYKWIGGKL